MAAAIASAEFNKSRSEPSMPIAPAPGPSVHAIASGLTGDMLGLAAIDFATKRSGFDDAILAAAEALARDVEQSPALGFFTGQAGIAFVLALVGQKYARNDLLAASRRFSAERRKISSNLIFSPARRPVTCGACFTRSAIILHSSGRSIGRCAR
jgi:lantibiotic modifying enzyme